MWTSYVRVTTIYRILRRSGSRHKHNQGVPHAVGVSAFWWPSGDPWSPLVRSSDGTVGPQTGPWDGSVATPNHTQLLTARSKVSTGGTSPVRVMLEDLSFSDDPTDLRTSSCLRSARITIGDAVKKTSAAMMAVPSAASKLSCRMRRE